MSDSGAIPENLRNDSGNPPFGFWPSRARAEQGAGSREQGAWNGDSRSTSRNMTQARESDTAAMMRLAEISWLDAMTIAVVTIRPDWAPLAVRGVLARTKGSRTELATAALRAACDPDVRGPGAIENFDDRKWVTRAQTYPSVREALNPPLCDEHGGVAGACALCRAGVGA